MRVTCKHCGGAHPAYECRKKSTAARKDVRQRNLSQPRLATEVDGPPTVQGHGLAGTQALPVDTNSEVNDMVGSKVAPVRDTATTSAGTVGNKDRQTNSSARLLKGSSGIGLASPAKVLDAEAANNKDAHTPKRTRGRPRTITDMKVYKAMKQREYRARKKNG